MKLTTGFLKKLIKEEMEKMGGDTVKVASFSFGRFIEKNDDSVPSEELAAAFGPKGEKLYAEASERQGGGSVDQDAFIEHYLKREFNMSYEEIARKYADHIGANYVEEEDGGSEEDY